MTVYLYGTNAVIHILERLEVIEVLKKFNLNNVSLLL